MVCFHLLLLVVLPQDLAITSSGQRIPCGSDAAIGDLQVKSPFGIINCPTDPVSGLVDTAAERALLRKMRNNNFSAWAQRCNQRGLLSELTTALTISEADQLSVEQISLLMELVRQWGYRIDPLPARLSNEERIELAWDLLGKADLAQGALLCGRLLEEIGGPGASPKRRLGLADLRRGLRTKSISTQCAAAVLAAHQQEADMFRPLTAFSLEDPNKLVRAECADAMLVLSRDESISQWAMALLRGAKGSYREIAAEHLGNSEADAALPVLMVAVAAARREPGSFFFSGRQISLVTDFDVEVAGGAAIANPITTVLTEGTMLEVRIISTSVSRAAMRALRRLSGENPGEREEDWLEWWRERKMSL